MAGLGKRYSDGEIIVRQGEMGNCMYVIQDGEVEVVKSQNGKNVCLATLGQGEFFGEISLFANKERTATVRAKGDVRIITVEKKIFLGRIQEDVTLAFRIFQSMADRINNANSELVALKGVH